VGLIRENRLPGQSRGAGAMHGRLPVASWLSEQSNPLLK